jgi:hypothetical protein
VKPYLVLALCLTAAVPASAQQPASDCAAGVTQDICQKTVDLFRYMAPQLAGALAGGNAVLGGGGSLGGIGHFSIGIRASGVRGTVPRVQDVQPVAGAAQASTYQTGNQLLGVPTADLAIGLGPQRELGILRLTGVDLLVSAQYLRNINASSFSVSVPGGSTKLGAGARVGFALRSGPLPLPEFGISYLRRALPTVNLRTSVNADRLDVDDLDIRTDSWRLTAGYGLGPLRTAAGVGRDSYSSAAHISATVAPRAGPPPTPEGSAQVAVSQKVSRSTVFINVGLDAGLLKLVGEIGRVSGGTIDTFNQFAGTAADASRTLGSLGVVIAF